jgi:hypothetical protein
MFSKVAGLAADVAAAAAAAEPADVLSERAAVEEVSSEDGVDVVFVSEELVVSFDFFDLLWLKASSVFSSTSSIVESFSSSLLNFFFIRVYIRLE